MNWNYIGGFFDGEGCVRLTSEGSRPHITISQKHSGILQLIQDFARVPSKIVKANNKHGEWYLLSYTGIRAIDFAKKLVNYTILKRQQLILLIQAFDESDRTVYDNEITRLKHVEAIIGLPDESLHNSPWHGKMRFQSGQRDIT